MVWRGDAGVTRPYIVRWNGLPVALLETRTDAHAMIRCRDRRVLGWSDEEIDEALGVVFRDAPELDELPGRWNREVARRLDAHLPPMTDCWVCDACGLSQAGEIARLSLGLVADKVATLCEKRAKKSPEELMPYGQELGGRGPLG